MISFTGLPNTKYIYGCSEVYILLPYSNILNELLMKIILQYSLNFLYYSIYIYIYIYIYIVPNLYSNSI